MANSLIVYLSAPWNYIVGIILFLVALGILITIHELGHLIVAKIFKVYCSDFSIGFGPKIFKFKRKKGETTYSLGVIPLGGYVRMYSDVSEELPDGVEVTKERSLRGISRWKRILILFAGVFMNFILAFVMFLIATSCFPQFSLYTNFEKNENFDTALSSLRLDIDNDGIYESLPGDNETSTDSFVFKTYFYTVDGKDYSVSTVLPDCNFAYIDPNTSLETVYVLSLDTNTADFGLNNRDYADFFVALKAEEFDTFTYDENNNKISGEKLFLPVLENGKFVKYTLIKGDTIPTMYPNIYHRDTGSEEMKLIKGELKLIAKDNGFESFGYSLFAEQYRNNDLTDWRFENDNRNFIVQSMMLWHRSFNLIGNALGNLFVGQGWENVGGPVAILSSTSKLLSSNPFHIYIEQWALISVNLGIVNLLPIPGLDGYQILIEIIELCGTGCKRIKNKAKAKKQKTVKEENYDENTVTIGEKVDDKEENQWRIPEKVKNIISYIGLGLIFTLAAVIFVVDIIRLF